MSDKRYKKLPDPVHTLLAYYNAHLVGSAAHWYIDPESREPNDFDMIVEPGNLPEVNLFLKGHMGSVQISVNSMGGLKAQYPGGLEIDYWEDTIGRYCQKAREMGFGRIAIVGLNPKLQLREP
jgi:hypothetical protein